jgi:hypothetical protein
MDSSEKNRRRDLFFEDAARAFDTGLAIAERRVGEGKSAVEAAREGIFAALHNLFVTFDHGTALSDDFNVYVMDEDGNESPDGALHEDFVDHLFETGRHS